MDILITGGGGFIGKAAAAHFRSAGWRVWRLAHQADAAADEKTLLWQPLEDIAPDLPPVDVALHLAGENIFGFWTDSKKKRIYDSRVKSTALLARRLADASRKPSAFLCASAVGFYGHRGEQTLDETAGSGEGFLAGVCRDWEAAARPAQDAGIRTVFLRFGMVLDPSGGPLAKMLTPFKMGLGGPLGGGQQWISWIALADAIAAIDFLIDAAAISGAVNLTSPNPARQKEFAATLGGLLHRPSVAAMPTAALKALLGAMADEVFLSSIRAVPQKLSQAGFVFRWPQLAAALAAMLGATH